MISTGPGSSPPSAHWITSAACDRNQVVEVTPKASLNDQGTTPGAGLVW